MITREQVADLQPGDVVEYRRDDWPEGCYVHSPLKVGYGIDSGLYVLDGHFGVRTPDGRPYEDMATLTVVSRAPRPLYVNHPRTEPVPYDVVRDADDHQRYGVWLSSGLSTDGDQCWINVNGEWCDRSDLPARLRLLVDGETRAGRAMTRRQLLFAVLLTAAAIVKGARVFFESVDDMTSWLVEKSDEMDLNWDVPDTLPAWMERAMTGERLPKILRTREAVAQQQGPAHIPYFNDFLQEDYCHADGEPYPCLWVRQNTPPRCKCSHAATNHRYDAGNCWMAACRCTTYRPQETA